MMQSDFDVLEFLGIGKNIPNADKHRRELGVQMLSFALVRLVADQPEMEEKIKKYFEEYKSKVSNQGMKDA